tara:strand:+ start:121718 stop:122635 length:918 start_codon:yes stop_codon:yes gene_type:complete
MSAIARRFLTRQSIFSAFAIAGIGATLTIGGCDSLGPKHHYTHSMLMPHVVGSGVDVQSGNGSIVAFTTERENVSIKFDLYGHDLDRLELAVINAMRDGDDTLQVWVDWPGGKRQNGEGASIELELPDTTNLTAQTSNGYISIAGISGHAQLKTSNGSVTVENHDGTVYSDTSNGRVQIEHVSGSVEVYTSNGRVIITDAFGPIRAETSNGKVYASTMDGNPGPVRIRTSNGSVTLDLGDGFEGILKCDTSNGKVRLEGIGNASVIESSSKHVELQVGDSKEVSAVRTSNGSISVQERQPDISDG